MRLVIFTFIFITYHFNFLYQLILSNIINSSFKLILMILNIDLISLANTNDSNISKV